jgi:hypothetical protein
MASHKSPEDVSPEQTLKSFEDAHRVRLASVGTEAGADLERAAEVEREALYRHAGALRTHAARLAKLGR